MDEKSASPSDDRKHIVVEAHAGHGRFKVEGVAIATKNGVTVTLLGGERPHIGALALAIRRPSLKDKTKDSVTSSVITLVGHKDDVLARPTAEIVAKKLKMTAVVVAGIHVEDAGEEDIDRLISNSNTVVNKLLERVEKIIA